MRTSRKNKQRMYYSIQTGETPIYQRDSDGEIQYLDIDGVMTPIPTGETEILYSEPQEFYASVGTGTGETQDMPYGMSTESFDLTLICQKGSYQIEEGSLIWFQSEVGFKEIILEDGTVQNMPDKTTADYTCTKVAESLNFVKYMLKAVEK